MALLDPPYEDTAALTAALEALGPLLTPNARVVAKHFWRDAPPARVGLLASERERRFGETALTFYRPDRRHHGGRMSVAVYPGSFDPITNGHLDIIGRAANVFDRVIVAVLANPRKTPLLPVEERIRVIRESLAEDGAPADRIEVASFDGLTVDFCHAHEATAIVRGLRAISDFETEMQLAHNNRVLAPDDRHGLLHDLDRERLRQLEPRQGDRELRRATSRRCSRRPRPRPWRPPSAAADRRRPLAGRPRR